MKPIRLAGVSLAALCIASAAQAAVTPEEVWANWQAFSERWDQQMTAERTERQGDSLIVSGVKVVQDKEGSHTEGTIDRITLADQGDGTVLVTMSERFPMTVVSTPPAVEGEPAPEPVTSQVVQTYDNLRVIASGEPTNIRNDITADRIVMTVTDVKTQDTPVPMNMTVTVRALEGYWEGLEQMDSVTRADGVDLMFKFVDDTQRMSFDTRLQDVSITAAGESSAAQSVGFLGQIGFAYVTSTYRMDMAGPKTLLAEGETGAGTMNIDLRAEDMTVDTDVENTTLRLAGTQMPFPMDLQMAGVRQSVTAPLQPSQAENAPFHMMLDLRDVTASEETWTQVDPKGALPRDPAQLSLSLRGAGEEPPVVTLENLRVLAAGAELTGQGQMTPTPDAVGPTAGLGRGRVDLTLRGGNGLLDRLVAGGLLPAEQEMAARMALGAFGRAVPGQTDTITSDIRFGNGLSVNGIPLQ